MSRCVKLFAALVTCLAVWGQAETRAAVGGIVGGGTGSGNLSTNSFTTTGGIGFGKGLLNQRNIFWDDFDGPTLNSVGFLQRLSPSGHRYYMQQGVAATGTNGFLMTGGRWTQTNIVSDPCYIGVTNTSPKVWNRIGCVFRFKTNSFALAPPYSAQGVINCQTADFNLGGGEYLHSGTLIDSSVGVQRSLAETILTDGTEDGGLYLRDRVFYEINFFTNVVIVEVNGVFRMQYHTNLQFAFQANCPVWENNGSSTNTISLEYESIWAGYADPALEAYVMQYGNKSQSRLVPGVGGALTNITLLASDHLSVVNGFTNVSLRAIMGTATSTQTGVLNGLRHDQRLVITNGTGTARTLEFSQVTNAWRFQGTYGTNAPNTLTNSTKMVLDFECDGTNVTVNYNYFAWP